MSQAIPLGEARFEGMPSFAEMEAAAAIIGNVEVHPDNIFDTADPREGGLLYQWANTLHIRTRTGVIENVLLFKRGDRLSVRQLEETERLLRANSFIQSVTIRPAAWHDGIVDLQVITRDTWSLEPGFNFSRQGGANSTALSFSEHNFLGTGVTLGLRASKDTDRKGTEYFVSDDHAFDGWTRVQMRLGNFDDGKARQASAEHPFYSLDSRWEAAASVADDHRIDKVYAGGDVIGGYRHATRQAEIRGGLSDGLVNGWARRYSLGLRYRTDEYRPESTLGTSVSAPRDQTNVTPFLRVQWVQDDFARLINRDQIERVEYFPLGLNATAELGRDMSLLGASGNRWQYSLSLMDGFTFADDHHLLLSTSTSGHYGSDGGEDQFYSLSARYYRPQRGRGLLFASLSGDTVDNGTTNNQYSLGGDSGLRGYPRNYQTGVHRVLFSVEQRAYTEWYPFRLFHIGGAVFYDAGRAWEGVNQNTRNSGWLSDVGIGLRIASARSAFGNVLHIDYAVPLNRDATTPSHQFLIKSYTNF